MRIAIVGGSLSGLFVAVLMRQADHEVTLFERSSTGLEGRGAGLVGQKDLFAILRAVGCEHVARVGVVADERIFLDRSGTVVRRQKTPQTQISWDYLYRVFRDRLEENEYRTGHPVEAVGQGDEAAWLELADGTRIEADLVVGADGIGSVVRPAVTNSMEGPRYAGYVAWRGLIPESTLPAEAAELLLDRFTFFNMRRSHMLGYLVPGPHGEIQPGERRYNWVWYRTEDDLPSRLTDRNGLVHPFALSPGSVADGARDAMLIEARAQLPSAFAQAVAAEATPFIQAIFDYEAPRMTRGRIVLLGDAACVVRPHTAMGVAKAAGDAIALRAMLDERPLSDALAAYEYTRLINNREIAAYGRKLGQSLEL
jgi:2-polyprenyl-6-methoxyphenol hydroxylase-like FAD-dependent oxidoreductase